MQYNEYYAYGLQTANSWTRENTTANNFLGNGGTELNTTTALYDLEYRNYDPVLARMTQVDPMASKYASWSPYNYSFNSPAVFSDPDGADPNNKREPLPTDANPDPGTGWGAWHLPGMGGGGSRLGGGSYSSFSSFFSSAMSSSFGGSWSGGIGSLFENSDQAFRAGADYNFYHNSWGNTYYGSYENSYIGYAALKSTGTLLSPESVSSAIKFLRQPQEELMDVTAKFYAQLGFTELFFTLAKEMFDNQEFTVPGNAFEERLRFFASQVGNGAPFDITVNGKGFSVEEIGRIAIFEGRTYNFDDFGNINFGYAARTLGIPLNDALKGAGLNQVLKGNGDWNNSQGYFDHSRDTQAIIFGYNYIPPWPIISPK